ncbi:40-residue YVTN family beta-propeller [Bacillus thuringiensis]|uniref:40-residue YVTN family beta-propeller n=1 Tax=Bacillus thuringiensis TaxID=1428 RepID=A0A9X6TXP7_BACTU|nr:YncE family protein [Bacillus thuringiensis]PEC75409.1 40-residue YVTN family beta-propeller [Bacillus thuringiensis]PED12726.1 40-residue YVTN family beta-propeller [Bacillus thuringiensis]PEF89151.1 40-residue YVTN family beta-propeller [Bacillus thuringiensis]PES57784.1 40-residue YVTN family beta-propeller [Bacillus thuringiensis]PFD84781.1 40-residue YVTN family beta-propeller [Bacillus thuringiensis]
MLPCQGTCNQYVDFEVLITAPEGYIINDTNYTGAVTWNTNRLKCAFESCTLQTPNSCLLQDDLPDGSYPVHSVRIYGVITMLVSISPVQNQYGQGDAAFSKWHKFSINQIVYYTTDSNCCFDFSSFKLKSLTVTPQDENTFIVNGTLSVLPVPPNPPVYAFTANKDDNTLSVINTATKTVQHVINLPYQPIKVAVTPNKTYTIVLQSNNSVSMINNKTLTIISTFSINSPLDIGFSLDNQFAYILNTLTDSMGITVINLLTQTISNTISLRGFGFSSIAIDPNGQYAYIVNYTTWSIVKVDLNTGEIVVDLPTSNDYPYIIEISLLDGFAYVTEELVASGTILTIIDLSTFQGIGYILTGAYYNSFLALSPNKPVALLGEETIDEINIIDTAQHQSTGTISINDPKSAVFTPDGKFIYIAQPEQNTVTILNSVDYTVNTVVTVGASPVSVAI